MHLLRLALSLALCRSKANLCSLDVLIVFRALLRAKYPITDHVFAGDAHPCRVYAFKPAVF